MKRRSYNLHNITFMRAACGFIGSFLVSLSSLAGSILFDPAPLSPAVSNGYTVASLNGQSPTTPVIIGGTNAWAGSASTTVMQAGGPGLSYPSGSPLKSFGGFLYTSNSPASDVQGRYLFRSISGAPTSGTVYVSVVIQLNDLAAISGWTTNLQQNGAGFGRTNTVPANAKLPTNGVYFGFTKLATGVAGIIMRVGTNDVVLTNSVTAATPYHCMARIAIGAGMDGKEVVSAVLNPTSVISEPTEWAATIEAEILAGGDALAYYGVGGTYWTNGKAIGYDEFGMSRFFCNESFSFPSLVTFVDSNTSVMVDAAIGATAAAQLSVASNSPSLYFCYGTSEGSLATGSWAFAEEVAVPAVTGTVYTRTIAAASLASNTLYACGFVAASAASAQYYSLGTFLNGEAAVVSTSDAQEKNAVAGVFTVSRPSNAEAKTLPLTLAYTVGGTAVAGVDYDNTLPGSVTIPAGATSAQVTVVPRLTPASTASPTVTITLSPGRAWVGASNSATMTIHNYDIPADQNVWVAPAPGYASDSNNWSQGRVPVATDAILLEAFSTNSMTWDAPSNGLPDAVASWTQTSNYTGTVTFPINYTNVPGAVFTNFVITSNAVVSGGTWTHPSNNTAQTYHLKVSVGGDFSLGRTASVTVQGKGYGVNRNPTGGALGVHGGARDDFSKVYGDLYHPADIGSGNYAAGYTGGGAIWLEIAGAAILDGTISAKPVDGDPGGHPAVGAGGSVYIKAASASGMGTISVSGNGYYGSSSGSGGRIAVELTQASSLGMNTTNFTARGGWGNTSTGAGTILIKTATQPYGTLIIDNLGVRSYGCQPPTKYGTTCITSGQIWTVDSLVFRNYGVLSVPTGTTLRLPNGLESVSSPNTALQGGILYMGGTIELGTGTPWTFTSNWVFQADSPYTIAGDVTVTRGGALGCIPLLRNTTNAYARMNLTVVGNLNVASDGKIVADNAGVDSSTYLNGTKGYHGGQSAADSTSKAYGSVLNPVLPGGLAQNGDAATIRGGGGSVMLTVTGNLNVDGAASATSTAGGNWPGAGGTLNLTAGTLTGSGTIKANGGTGSASAYAGGGGRVAIRLTGPGSAFNLFVSTNISATGSSSGTNSAFASSAGTLYLQDAATAEGAGLIIVRNDNNAANTNSVTYFPSTSGGGQNDVFDKAMLSVENRAIVRLTKTLAMQSAAITTNTTLDLNGFTLMLKGLTINGARIPAGNRAAADFVSGVSDSSPGKTGRIVIAGGGLLLSIQ